MKHLKYSLVIDTNCYAGNFERELTAYCTGVVGDCGVGDDKAELYHEEETYEFDLRQENDEGCDRPCKIHLTPNPNGGPSGYFNSVEIYFDAKPIKEEVSLIARRAEKFFKEVYKITYGHDKDTKISIDRFRLKTTKTVEEFSEIIVDKLG